MDSITSAKLLSSRSVPRWVEGWLAVQPFKGQLWMLMQREGVVHREICPTLWVVSGWKHSHHVKLCRHDNLWRWCKYVLSLWVPPRKFCSCLRWIDPSKHPIKISWDVLFCIQSWREISTSHKLSMRYKGHFKAPYMLES